MKHALLLLCCVLAGCATPRPIDSKDPAVRRDAVLAAATRPEQLALVGRALGDRDERVSEAARAALAGVGEEAVPAIARALHDRDPWTRWGAANALCSLKGKARAAAVDLVAALHDRNAGVRRIAAAALGYVDPDPAIALPGLVAAIHDEDSAVRDSAIRALGAMGPAAAPVVPMLVGYAEEDADCLVAVLNAVADIGPAAREAVPMLLRCARDEGAVVRGCAILALGKVGGEEAMPVVLAALGDHDSFVQYEASEACAAYGRRDARIVPALAERLASPDPEARLQAAEALRALGADAREALPALARTAREGDPKIAWSVCGAMAKIGPEGVTELAASLDDASWARRNQAAMALSCTEEPSALAPAAPLLIRAFQSPDPMVRVCVVEILGRLEPRAEGTEEVLQKALQDADEYVRECARKALDKAK